MPIATTFVTLCSIAIFKDSATAWAARVSFRNRGACPDPGTAPYTFATPLRPGDNMGLPKLATALLPVVLSLAAALDAAEPEFKAARVLESRTYEREKHAVVIAGVRTPAATESTSRVTVVVEGTRITAEWVPKTAVSTDARDFPRGSDVTVAVNRNQLLLKHPDGIVTAKIIKRVEPEEDERRD